MSQHRLSRRTFLVSAVGTMSTLVTRAPLHAQQTSDVRIALSSSSLSAVAPRIAQELGLFARQGLKANFSIMESANTAVAALISGSADAVMAAPPTLISANARGQKIVAVANGYAGSGATLVLSRAVAEKMTVAADAPVTERLKAVDGLLIAMPEPTGAYTITFKSAFGSAGANVRATYMGQTAMQAAMESGAVQGFVAGAPFWASPVLKGSGIVWVSGPKGEIPKANASRTTSCFDVRRDVAEANPALMKRYAAVFADLRKAIEERPVDVKAAVARLYPELDAKTLDLLYASESRAWNAPPLTVADMAQEIEFLKASGVQIAGIENVKPEDLIYS